MHMLNRMFPNGFGGGGGGGGGGFQLPCNYMQTRTLARHPYTIVWVPAPSQEEEGSGTLRIDDLFFTPHGYHGVTNY